MRARQNWPHPPPMQCALNTRPATTPQQHQARAHAARAATAPRREPKHHRARDLSRAACAGCAPHHGSCSPLLSSRPKLAQLYVPLTTSLATSAGARALSSPAMVASCAPWSPKKAADAATSSARASSKVAAEKVLAPRAESVPSPSMCAARRTFSRTRSSDSSSIDEAEIVSENGSMRRRLSSFAPAALPRVSALASGPFHQIPTHLVRRKSPEPKPIRNKP
mmetsp:Transcript_105/g.330  ORF Transcript_105/g.330 Transcript_105/m.330 type:complete len:223 (+) Transcript_105:384-1052(+)